MKIKGRTLYLAALILLIGLAVHEAAFAQQTVSPETPQLNTPALDQFYKDHPDLRPAARPMPCGAAQRRAARGGQALRRTGLPARGAAAGAKGRGRTQIHGRQRRRRHQGGGGEVVRPSAARRSGTGRDPPVQIRPRDQGWPRDRELAQRHLQMGARLRHGHR
ncbi:hypothetical protein LP419_31995 [Massilia sp. H-1]|nr:hypothetical protein LP419_31995 [Massilia sp. H-1]